jgi:protein-S-isoprenylcysteine O-methyltransferase Ste14
MNERIKAHVDSVFAGAPSTKKIMDLKEEMLSNMNSKYDDLVADGFSSDDAYRTVVSGMGDISELIRQIQNESAFNSQYPAKSRTKSAVLTSIAVMLFVLCPVIIILFAALLNEPILGVILMLTLISIGVGLLVFNSMTKPKYIKEDETIVEEFKEWKSQNSEDKRIRNAISGVLWPLIVVIYLAVSFLFMAWPVSWIIFLIGVCIEGVISLVFTLKGGKS